MSELPPADWYPDPQDSARLRYWDGTTWTAHTTTAPTSAVTPVAATAAAASWPSGGGAPAGWSPPPRRSFGEAYAVCMARYVDWSGRASRSEYWWFYLGWVLTLIAVAVVVGVVAAGVGLGEDESGVLALVVLLALVPPLLSAQARRLHDTGRSAWWLVLSLVPFGGLVLFVFTVLEGTPGPNRYG